MKVTRKCKKCGKDIYDIHEREDANKVINERILKFGVSIVENGRSRFKIF